jgi:hypothetical protein
VVAQELAPALEQVVELVLGPVPAKEPAEAVAVTGPGLAAVWATG